MIEARVIAALILTPFALAFAYSAIHEILRYKSQGRADYGLSYDEKTGTTHVTAIDVDADVYDPDEFDPGEYRDPDIRTGTDDETARDESRGRS